MSEAIKLPKFEEDLADFVAGLRNRIFASRLAAARHFHLTRSTASRYESGHLKPPLGYVAGLIKLNLENLQKQGLEVESYRQELLRQLNKVLRWHYREEYLSGKSLQNWNELERLAQSYQSERQKSEPNDAPTLSQPNGQIELDLGLELEENNRFFYGRASELSQLENWLLNENCRLVAVSGLGGIGKTSLVAELARRVGQHFDGFLWRSLRNAPTPAALLTDCLRTLAGQPDLQPPKNPSEQISKLLELLRKKRYLLVLDNFEAVLEGGTLNRRYVPEYESYGELLSRLAETAHQSCLVITTREKPSELALAPAQVRTLALSGLGQPESSQIFADYDLRATPEILKNLVERYSGNPLALKLVAATVAELFGGRLADFLKETYFVPGDVSRLLDQQFERLSRQEQNIMYRLAVAREPLDLAEIQAGLHLPTPSKKETLAALYALHNKSLLESGLAAESPTFTQQAVIMEYTTERLLTLAAQELSQSRAADSLEIIRRVALTYPTGKHYLQVLQAKLILQPLLDRLAATFGSREAVEKQLSRMLNVVREIPVAEQAFAGGNLANLLRQLKGDLSGYDFSDLNLWQANFQAVRLQNSNLSRTDLSQTLFSEFFDAIFCVALNPAADLIAAGSSDGYIYLWQIADGKTWFSFKAHENQVNSLAFSPDGRWLATGSSDQTVKIWDCANRRCVAALTEHSNWVWGVAFSPDGRWLVSGSSDKSVNFWQISSSLPDGECEFKFSHALTNFGSTIRAVAFSPDSRWLATGGGEQEIKIWEISSGQCRQSLVGHRGWIQNLTFSPDGQFLASVGEDTIVHLWQKSSDGAWQAARELVGHSRWVWAAAFSPDSQFLVSSSDDSTLRVWDVPSGQCRQVLDDLDDRHTGAVQGVASSGDGTFIVSGSADRSVKVWQMPAGRCLRTLHGYSNSVKAVALAANEETLALACDGGRSVALWEIADQKHLATTPQTEIVRSVALGSRFFLTGDEAGQVVLWAKPNGEENGSVAHKKAKGHSSWVQSVVLSSNERWAASAGGDKIVQLWEVQPELPNFRAKKTLSGHTEWIWDLGFSGDGNFLASAGGKDRTLRIWATATGEISQIIQDKSWWALAVALNQTGTLVASGGDDGSVRIWDRAAPTQPLAEWANPELGHIWTVALSQDERYLAAGSESGLIKVWEIATGACRVTLHGHRGWVRTVAFMSSKTDESWQLLSGSEDGTLRLWEVESGTCLAVLENPRLYQGLRLTEATGLTATQKAGLRMLGAQL